jgi:hypothetical protein
MRYAVLPSWCGLSLALVLGAPALAAPTPAALTATEAAWASQLSPRHLDLLPCTALPVSSQARVAEADGWLPWVNLRAAACVASSPGPEAAAVRLRWARDPSLAGLASVVLDALPTLPASEATTLAAALREGPHATWAAARLASHVGPTGARP